MSQWNVCVLCLVSIWDLFMCLRTKCMMTTTMLLDPFIKFQSWVILVWNGRRMPKGLGLLQKILQKVFKILFSHRKLQHLLQMRLCILWISSKRLSQNVSISTLFIDLFNSFDEDGTLLISLYPLTSSLHTRHYTLVSTYSQYSIWDIPFVLSAVDCFRALSFATHVSFKLRDLNYNNFHIENVRCISTTFNGDVLFEFPPIINPDSHFKQM